MQDKNPLATYLQIQNDAVKHEPKLKVGMSKYNQVFTITMNHDGRPRPCFVPIDGTILELAAMSFAHPCKWLPGSSL